ncbi:MAG: DUF2961 domain-containing protein [Phycisphaerales bacterium]|nr:DUF2961 domain-containing protein [Phycisphaerales bacterium]
MVPPGPLGLDSVARLDARRTRSVSAENPTGAVAGGAQANPGDDGHCTPAARRLGRGWKVRPCLRNLEPGASFTLADLEGPGVVRHLWMTVPPGVHRWLRLEATYDDAREPSIRVPLGDFFANGIDGAAGVASIPIAVNPHGGMNSYWPMPFRRRLQLLIHNDGPEAIKEIFYQATYTLEEVVDGTGHLHVAWRRSTTGRDHPEHTILEPLAGRGHYVGTYLVWNQLSSRWWGEGEVKFFLDGDPEDAPTICGTGTEDYFGGAWGFVEHNRVPPGGAPLPSTYSTAYLGYPQALYEATTPIGPRPPAHGLYRWHLPDPIAFERDIRATVQALGWWPDGTFQPLADDIASTAFLYLAEPTPVPALPPMAARWPR